MKNFILLGFCLVMSVPIFADCQDEALRSPDPMALTTALMGIADQLLTTLPGLIQEIAQFPKLAQADALALENEMKVAATLVGAAKQQKIQQLFVDGVNLTILVTNIINNFMVMISSIGPLAEAIDQVNGAKVENALQLTALILQMISKIDIAMKNSIIAGGTVPIAPSAVATPALNPIPDL